MPSVGNDGLAGSVEGRVVPGLSFGFDGITVGILILGLIAPGASSGLEFPRDGRPEGRVGF